MIALESRVPDGEELTKSTPAAEIHRRPKCDKAIHIPLLETQIQVFNESESEDNEEAEQIRHGLVAAGPMGAKCAVCWKCKLSSDRRIACQGCGSHTLPSAICEAQLLNVGMVVHQVCYGISDDEARRPIEDGGWRCERCTTFPMGDERVSDFRNFMLRIVYS